MSSSVEQIKERLGIADIIGSYITLEKAGRNFRARCPFHNERTPSFFVSPERNTFHCFGCDKGGDIFEFVEAFEGVDFLGALRLLADKAGVTIEREDPRLKDEKYGLYRAMEEATLFYERALHDSLPAREYIKKRGIQDTVAKEWRIGFAPNDWRALLSFLASRGIPEKTLLAAGLVIKSEGGRQYDRFRGRIMFPIADSVGRTIGFSGRILEEHAASPAATQEVKPASAKGFGEAKYINSPETPLYSKSLALYGFDKAKRAMREDGTCVVVEGQMDVVIAHQSGLKNAVASSGTALTEEHLKRIRRFTEKLVFAFDPDSAGLAAAERATKLALSLGMEARLAHLPPGEDPAALGRRSAEELCARVKNAKHAVDFFITALSEKGYDERQFKLEVGKKVLPFIAHLKNRIEQAHFISETARRINVREDALWEELRAVSSAAGVSPPAPQDGANERAKNSHGEQMKKHLIGLILWQSGKEKNASAPFLGNVQREVEALAGMSFEEYIRRFSTQEKERMMFDAEKMYERSVSLENDAGELVRRLSKHIIRAKMKKATAELAQAEQSRDEARVLAITKEIDALMKSLDSTPIHESR